MSKGLQTPPEGQAAPDDQCVQGCGCVDLPHSLPLHVCRGFKAAGTLEIQLFMGL